MIGLKTPKKLLKKLKSNLPEKSHKSHLETYQKKDINRKPFLLVKKTLFLFALKVQEKRRY